MTTRMTTDEDDPHPRKNRFVGLAVSFDHAGRRLVGTVESQRYIGRTVRGDIPDYTLSIRGASGARVEASLVESHATFPESP